MKFAPVPVHAHQFCRTWECWKSAAKKFGDEEFLSWLTVQINL